MSLTLEKPQADEARRRILSAAREEFLDFGLRRTTVDAVARRAGVGRMTLYRRFAGKDELVAAVVMRELEGFLDELDRVMDAGLPLTEQMTEGMVFTVLHARDHALLGRLLDTDPEATLPHLTLDGERVMEASIEFTLERVARTPEGTAMTPAKRRRLAEASTRLTSSLVLTPGGSGGDAASIRAFARQVVPGLIASASG